MNIEQQLKEAKEILKILEWYDYDTKHGEGKLPNVCPICGNNKKEGHTINCKLGRLLNS